MNNINLGIPCNTDCPQYCSGTCPFDLHSQESCPRWRAILKDIKYIIDAINILDKYFNDYAAMHDDISRIIVSYDHGLFIINVEMKTFDVAVKWPLPAEVETLESNRSKTDYIYMKVRHIIDRIFKEDTDKTKVQ